MKLTKKYYNNMDDFKCIEVKYNQFLEVRMSRTGENITRRKDGRWEARYIKGYIDGKAIYGYLYGKSYEEAKRKRDNTINQESIPIKFNQVVDAFLLQKKYQIKESTYAHYLWLINAHIKEYWGNIDVNCIDSTMLENFISNKIDSGKINGHGGLSSKSVKDILSLVKSIIRYGAEKGLINNRALLDVKSPKIPKKSIDVFTQTEREIIESNTISASDMYFGIYLCLYTGLRIGEICALKWSDIDLENEYISITKTISRINNTQTSLPKTKIIIDLPKSETSVRLIPLTPKLSMFLKERRPYTNDLFVLTRTEQYIEPRNYYEKYKTFLSNCGIKKHTFHALRHSFATNCIEKGFDPKTLSELLGHSNVKITLERYVHPSWDRKIQCMRML